MNSKNFAWQPSARGDIRASSMDSDYPWTIEPCLIEGGKGPTYWRAANLVTGWVGSIYETQEGARGDLRVHRLNPHLAVK